MPPNALHDQAETIVRLLVQRFGTLLPPDAETIVRYYLGCRAGAERAARDVLHLRRLLEGC
jgi:hypothetical protein